MLGQLKRQYKVQKQIDSEKKTQQVVNLVKKFEKDKIQYTVNKDTGYIHV